jgi:hypothetical protein
MSEYADYLEAEFERECGAEHSDLCDCDDCFGTTEDPLPNCPRGGDNVEQRESDPYIQIWCLDCCHATAMHGDNETAMIEWKGAL